MLLFGILVVGCNNGFTDQNETAKQNKDLQNLHKYDYVFRIVNIGDLNEARFAVQINDNATALQRLAVILSDSKAADRNRNVSNNSLLADLAQTAVTAYNYT